MGVVVFLGWRPSPARASYGWLLWFGCNLFRDDRCPEFFGIWQLNTSNNLYQSCTVMSDGCLLTRMRTENTPMCASRLRSPEIPIEFRYCPTGTVKEKSLSIGDTSSLLLPARNIRCYSASFSSLL